MFEITVIARFDGDLLLSSGGLDDGTPNIESGKARRPMRKAREKFSVARVARNMPRRSKEKHLMRRR